MYTGKTVFAQLMDLIPRHEFNACVARYDGDHKLKSFSCWDQFLCMAFAQLTWRRSLRDIEATLRSAGPRLYHMGFRGRVSRNTLANANQTRDWRIHADLAAALIGTARRLHADSPLPVDLESAVYAIDSTTIDLCLTLFPWATFRRTKAAIKLHTMLDLRSGVPSFIVVTPGRVHDVKFLDHISFEPGAYYVMDRAYVDFARLSRIHLAGAFFVTRLKSNSDWRRVESREADPETGVRSDMIIALRGVRSRKDYPDRLRRVRYTDPETGKTLVFLTNNMTLPALTIAQLYRSRWRIELFFKWIKGHLRIESFYGLSDNAVRTQIWTAISVFVLIVILRKNGGLPQSPGSIAQVLSVSVFEKTPIFDLFSAPEDPTNDQLTCRQLNLFD